MILLALRTGISPTQWADEGYRAVVTAFDLLSKNNPNPQPRGEAPPGWELL